MSSTPEQISECHLMQFYIKILMSVCEPYITKSRKNRNVILSLNVFP